MPPDPALPPELESGLRACVLAFKLERPRGHVPPTVRAGRPGAPASPAGAAFAPGAEPLDQHLRTEVAAALCHRVTERVPDPILWLTRSGDLDLCPEDLGWLAAGRVAWAEAGLAPSFVLVTRHGWRHHPSGRLKQWRRLRA